MWDTLKSWRIGVGAGDAIKQIAKDCANVTVFFLFYAFLENNTNPGMKTYSLEIIYYKKLQYAIQTDMLISKFS